MNERYKKGQVEGAKENKDEFRTKGRKCKWKDKRREQKRKKKNSHENEGKEARIGEKDRQVGGKHKQ